MSRLWPGFTLVVALMFPVGNAAADPFLSNGDFSQGLQAWTASGHVTVSGGHAVMGDAGTARSVLYQAAPLTLDWVTIEFEILNFLAGVGQGQGFPDAFFASLYFVNDPQSFDLENKIYDGALALLDMDADGIYNSAGSISAGVNGPEWIRFSATVPNGFEYVIPTFELFNLNTLDADSFVLVDDVALVPEPCALILFGIGGLLAMLARCRATRA